MATATTTATAVHPRTNQSARAQKRAGQIATYTALILLSALFIFPFYWMIRSSLMPKHLLNIWPPVWWPR